MEDLISGGWDPSTSQKRNPWQILAGSILVKKLAVATARFLAQAASWGKGRQWGRPLACLSYDFSSKLKYCISWGNPEEITRRLGPKPQRFSWELLRKRPKPWRSPRPGSIWNVIVKTSRTRRTARQRRARLPGSWRMRRTSRTTRWRALGG